MNSIILDELSVRNILRNLDGAVKKALVDGVLWAPRERRQGVARRVRSVKLGSTGGGLRPAGRTRQSRCLGMGAAPAGSAAEGATRLGTGF